MLGQTSAGLHQPPPEPLHRVQSRINIDAVQHLKIRRWSSKRKCGFTTSRTYLLLNRGTPTRLLAIWRPNDVRLDLARLCDSIFQHIHRIPRVISRRLDVVSGRRAGIRVPQDSLNHHIRYSQAVQVAPKAMPGRVPAVPLRDRAIALVFVICFLVI